MENKDNLRINLVYSFFALLFVVIGIRIFYLQILQNPFLKNLASRQYYRLVPLEGRRGDIFDRTGKVLATGMNSYSVFADPVMVKDAGKTAGILAANLSLPAGEIYRKLAKNKKGRFVWIKRKVSWFDKERIKKINLKGIGFIREEKRFYPQEMLASSVLGIVDVDNKGLEGMEVFYDNYLRGKNGIVRVLQDSHCREIIVSPQVITPQEGSDIVLTIDAQLQYWVENYLAETVRKFAASAGSVVVMDATTGEILSLANYPAFDPNSIDAASAKYLKNRAVCDMFEPGSVFKIVTLIAALDTKRYGETDTFFCENGLFKIPGATLHDWKPYGTLSFREVFKKSSNIGVGKIANGVGKEFIYSYIKKLRFGEKTGIDLPGEEDGSVKPLERWSKTTPYMVPIGQEVGVNILQLVRAIAVVANGGYLVKPHLLKSISGQNIYKDSESVKEYVLPPSTVEKAKDILISVVADGTGKLAAVDGIRIGGKTGTAQKFDFQLGRYSPSRYRANFVGFIDYSTVPLAMGITIDEPQKSHFGGVVAASLFKQIAQKCVKYLDGRSAFAKNEVKKDFSVVVAE